MRYVATKFPPMPTVKEMDDANDHIRVNLLMLRCLCTSDLAPHYGVFKGDTLRDMLYSMWYGLREHDNQHVVIPMSGTCPREGLSPDERAEYVQLCKRIEQWIKGNPDA